MRSPEPLVVLRWQLHPRPTGPYRFAAAYLTALTATAAATAIISASRMMSTSCVAQGDGCLSSYFRGVAIAGAVGLALLLLGSVGLKLGGPFFFALVAVIPVIALLGVLLRDSWPALPAMIICAAAAPALAAWITSKLS